MTWMKKIEAAIGKHHELVAAMRTAKLQSRVMQ
jgi:hypothetical protein